MSTLAIHLIHLIYSFSEDFFTSRSIWLFFMSAYSLFKMTYSFFMAPIPAFTPHIIFKHFKVTFRCSINFSHWRANSPFVPSDVSLSWWCVYQLGLWFSYCVLMRVFTPAPQESGKLQLVKLPHRAISDLLLLGLRGWNGSGPLFLCCSHELGSYDFLHLSDKVTPCPQAWGFDFWRVDFFCLCPLDLIREVLFPSHLWGIRDQPLKTPGFKLSHLEGAPNVTSCSHIRPSAPIPKPGERRGQPQLPYPGL